MMQFGKRLNASDRMTDSYVDEQQHSIECAAPDIDCFGSGHDRLTKIVIGQTPRLCARNLQGLGQLLRERLAIAGQNCSFQSVTESRSRA